MMKAKLGPSEFKNVKGIEYFKFEEDFIEENVRCIPMIVRFKMDETGIKLKLSAWSRFLPEERIELALIKTTTIAEKKYYRRFLMELIAKYTDSGATELVIDPFPAWRNLQQIPAMLIEKSEELHLNISISQWQNLTDIKRFALLKLCRPGHENKNFPKAVTEFGLLTH
ncbi:nitrate reductase associated protein [Pedobacter psychroterrae]|nr:nitrate reductase associated protein [Pedobacter psychroterrae]